MQRYFKLAVSSPYDLFYSFKAHNLESDIDALCVRLCFARSEEDFFIILHNSREPTRSIRYPLCQRGKGSLMRFKSAGISIDLPYAQLKVISIPEVSIHLYCYYCDEWSVV